MHLLIMVIELSNFRRDFTDLPTLQSVLGVQDLSDERSKIEK